MFKKLWRTQRQVAVDYPPCFLRKPSSCDFQLSTPRDVPKIRMFQHAATITIIGKPHRKNPGHPSFWGGGFVFHQKFKGSSPKKAPTPLDMWHLASTELGHRHKKKLSTGHKQHHPLCEWLDFCQPTGSQTAIGNPQKQLKGTNTECKNTIWYALRHFEKKWFVACFRHFAEW